MEKTNEILTIAGKQVEIRYTPSENELDRCMKCCLLNSIECDLYLSTYAKRPCEACHKRDMAQKKEIEKKLLAKAEKKYAKHIAAFVGLELVGAGFSIAVIPTVADVKVEGERMHHCVYKMGYYAVETSLLLSARSADGRRLETIEFDLERGKVLQSRAACNKTSPKHDAILAVMAAHSADIQKMWRRSNNQPNSH